MNTWNRIRHAAGLVLLLLHAGASVAASAETFQLTSTIDTTQGAPAAGGGDSGAPVLSTDGRYVLFSSTAGNLVATGSGAALPALAPPPLNVFLRDRTNGTTVLVSINASGTSGGNADSLPVGVSTNGRYALFESAASDLVAGDTNNASDVFLRDLTQGLTFRLSSSTNADVHSRACNPVMTPDGRYIAMDGGPVPLASGAFDGGTAICVRDQQTGETTLVSAGMQPQSASGDFGVRAITPDGRYVAFVSVATNLGASLPNGQDIYVCDVVTGATTWASAGARAAAQAVLQSTSVACYNCAISADGRFVAYEASRKSGTLYPGLILRYDRDTGLTDLVHTNAAIQPAVSRDVRNLDMTPDGQRIVFVASTNGTSGATTCILLWDAATGGATLVSGDLSGQVPANANCDWPAIDAGGRLVAFSNTATNLVAGAPTGGCHLYLRDLQAGVTTLLDSPESSIDLLTMPQLSADGRFVAFECGDGSIVANDRNRDADVVVRDLTTGDAELISARDSALPSLSPNGPSQLASSCVSADGNRVVFASEADNLVPNDINDFRDIFVHDSAAGTNILISVGTNGFSGNGPSFGPAISADGRHVGFTSHAANLVAADTNQATDVFVRDLQAGATTLASVNSSGTGPGNKESFFPEIGADGRYVMFRSKALNLVDASFTGATNLFVRDLQAGTTRALTTNGLSCAAMTADGHFVALVDMVGVNANKLYVWDSAQSARVYTNNTTAITNVAISPDGNRIAYVVLTNQSGLLYRQSFLTDRAANTTAALSTKAPASRLGLRFSANSRFLVHTATVSLTNQVYLYDCQTGTNQLISHSYDSTAPANASSDSPDISADGRFVAYRSLASNIVPGDTNGLPDILLFDRQTGSTTLVSVSRFGSFAANGRSLCPVFSADGQTLLFQTWASDMIAADFNHGSDILSYTLYSASPIPLFYATMHAAGVSGGSPWISWEAVPGRSYRVQCKDNVTDTDWQEVVGVVTIIGNQGYCQDIAPAATQRFYRIVGF